MTVIIHAADSAALAILDRLAAPLNANDADDRMRREAWATYIDCAPTGERWARVFAARAARAPSTFAEIDAAFLGQAARPNQGWPPTVSPSGLRIETTAPWDFAKHAPLASARAA